MTSRVTFIGFGEVAGFFSAAMIANGARVCAFDILQEDPGQAERFTRRVQGNGVTFLPRGEAIRGAHYVLSTVTTEAAEEAAQQCAGHLERGQTFVDFNATSPQVKIDVGNTVTETGATFVEGAILSAVRLKGARTRILTGGARAEQAAEDLNQLGLNTHPYHPQIGPASAFKMLRSVFSKGMEALLIEFLLAGRRAGIEDDLWKEVTSLFEEHSFDEVSRSWVRTHAIAHERRCHELTQVAQVVRELGIEPTMVEAAQTLFRRSAALELSKAFETLPASADEVIDELDRSLARGGGRSRV